MPVRMEHREAALHVSYEGNVGAAFGVALFRNVYTEVAALVEQRGREGADVRLFDPYAPAGEVFGREWPSGACLTLYSNHYQCGLWPTEDDLRNLAALPEGTRLYIVRGCRCVRWKGNR